MDDGRPQHVVVHPPQTELLPFVLHPDRVGPAAGERPLRADRAILQAHPPLVAAHPPGDGRRVDPVDVPDPLALAAVIVGPVVVDPERADPRDGVRDAALLRQPALQPAPVDIKEPLRYDRQEDGSNGCNEHHVDRQPAGARDPRARVGARGGRAAPVGWSAVDVDRRGAARQAG